jgi:hypothetical protein
LQREKANTGDGAGTPTQNSRHADTAENKKTLPSGKGLDICVMG